MTQLEHITDNFIGIFLLFSFGSLVVIMFFAWLLLPFAVWGIKKRLDAIVGVQYQIAAATHAATHRANVQRLEEAKLGTSATPS